MYMYSYIYISFYTDLSGSLSLSPSLFSLLQCTLFLTCKHQHTHTHVMLSNIPSAEGIKTAAIQLHALSLSLSHTHTHKYAYTHKEQSFHTMMVWVGYD